MFLNNSKYFNMVPTVVGDVANTELTLETRYFPDRPQFENSVWFGLFSHHAVVVVLARSSLKVGVCRADYHPGKKKNHIVDEKRPRNYIGKRIVVVFCYRLHEKGRNSFSNFVKHFPRPIFTHIRICRLAEIRIRRLVASSCIRFSSYISGLGGAH